MNITDEAKKLLAPIEVRARKAFKHICEIAEDPKKFIMSIPVREDEDSDCVLSAPCDDNEKLIAALKRASEAIDYASDTTAEGTTRRALDKARADVAAILRGEGK